MRKDDDVIDAEYEVVREREPVFLPGGANAMFQIVFWSVLIVALKVWLT